MFCESLQRLAGEREHRLVLTFINNLKNDLDRELGALARVSTFHGFCRSLLQRSAPIRGELTEHFYYLPRLPFLIIKDWQLVHGVPAPQFVDMMCKLKITEELDFYLQRANYYDAVGFDDSVFRTYVALAQNHGAIEPFDLVLVDEFQDFNKLEAEFIAFLSNIGPILIAGDDDQALYSQLRSATPQFIRELHSSGSFSCFSLPYCMRCTEVIVEAVNDLLNAATAHGKMRGRIDKPFRYYPPQKEEDSVKYPTIRAVETSVQRNGTANYFGKYVAQQINIIPASEIAESHARGWLTALIIGPRHYTRQIQEHLEGEGLHCDGGEAESPELTRADGLRILKDAPNANLGWRILVEVDRPASFETWVSRSIEEERPLAEVLATDYVKAIQAELEAWEEPPQPEAEEREHNVSQPSIRITTFEGSKGLSASHVFIVGFHNGDLPRNPQSVDDLEICKFLVALTRTRKQCHILFTRNWGGQWKQPSTLLSWIRSQRKQVIRVNKDYWIN